MDVRRALALDWLPPAVQQRLDALASDKGKAPAGEAAAKPLANGKSGGAKAAKAAAAQHPLAPPPEVLERLRRELRLSKLQAVTVWRALLVRAAWVQMHALGRVALGKWALQPARAAATACSLVPLLTQLSPSCLRTTTPAVRGGQGRGGCGGGRGQPDPRRPGGAAGGCQRGRARWARSIYLCTLPLSSAD